MHPTQKLLLFALLVVLASSLIEAVVLSWRQSYNWRAMGVTLFNMTGRITLAALIPLSIASPAFAFAWSHRLATIQMNTWLAFLLLFLGQEFCYYWFHRASHRVRWFWSNHAVHHSPNELNLSTALRAGMFSKLIGVSIFFLPLVWLGFPPQLVLLTLTLNLLYQFWVHVTWIPKLGWLEYVLNTPSAHRVHHASNAEYLDANYGGVLIIFDRLFGTYVKEREDLPCRYGLTDPITSHNPLLVEFREWGRLLEDLRNARSAKAILGYLFMPPGWKPEREESKAIAPYL
jgi:sterol desaturase/sphingolipid hydroxylase (fatty acid hydroxylase superfamily)